MNTAPKLCVLASNVLANNFEFKLGNFSSFNSDVYDQLTIMHAINIRDKFLKEFKRRVIVKQVDSTMTRYSDYYNYVAKLNVTFNAEDGSKIFSKVYIQRSRMYI